MKFFSVRDALKHGTILVIDNIKFITLMTLSSIGVIFAWGSLMILAVMAYLVKNHGMRVFSVYNIAEILAHHLHGFALGIGLLIILVMIILIEILHVGYLQILLNIYDNKSVQLKYLFSGWYLAPSFIIATVLYWTMVLIGLIFFIVPGIYLGIIFQFYTLILIETKCGPIEALKRSYVLTSGIKWDLTKWSAVATFIMGSGHGLLKIFFLIPAVCIANIEIYRTLIEKTQTTEIE